MTPCGFWPVWKTRLIGGNRLCHCGLSRGLGTSLSIFPGTALVGEPTHGTPTCRSGPRGQGWQGDCDFAVLRVDLGFKERSHFLSGSLQKAGEQKGLDGVCLGELHRKEGKERAAHNYKAT